jgi:hypothetical protein
MPSLGKLGDKIGQAAKAVGLDQIGSKIKDIATEGLKDPTSLFKYTPTGIAVNMAKNVVKKMHGRGAGTIPNRCKDTQDAIGGLCYEKCKDGYTRIGTSCKAKCQAGFVLKRERGPCWPETINRPKFDRRGKAKEDCMNSEEGKRAGKCERCPDGIGAFYPECPPGYVHRRGTKCGVCKKDIGCPDEWPKMGLKGACRRPFHIQMGRPRTACPPGKEKQNGLCYSPCPKEFPNGVGPVCWASLDDAKTDSTYDPKKDEEIADKAYKEEEAKAVEEQGKSSQEQAADEKEQDDDVDDDAGED